MKHFHLNHYWSSKPKRLIWFLEDGPDHTPEGVDSGKDSDRDLARELWGDQISNNPEAIAEDETAQTQAQGAQEQAVCKHNCQANLHAAANETGTGADDEALSLDSDEAETSDEPSAVVEGETATDQARETTETLTPEEKLEYQKGQKIARAAEAMGIHLSSVDDETGALSMNTDLVIALAAVAEENEEGKISFPKDKVRLEGGVVVIETKDGETFTYPNGNNDVDLSEENKGEESGSEAEKEEGEESKEKSEEDENGLKAFIKGHEQANAQIEAIAAFFSLIQLAAEYFGKGDYTSAATVGQLAVESLGNPEAGKKAETIIQKSKGNVKDAINALTINDDNEKVRMEGVEPLNTTDLISFCADPKGDIGTKVMDRVQPIDGMVYRLPSDEAEAGKEVLGERLGIKIDTLEKEGNNLTIDFEGEYHLTVKENSKGERELRIGQTGPDGNKMDLNLRPVSVIDEATGAPISVADLEDPKVITIPPGKEIGPYIEKYCNVEHLKSYNIAQPQPAPAPADETDTDKPQE